MPRFDRYVLSQLLMLFGFFSLVLVLVYWVNRAVVLFDRLISNGQSALVFLEFTALSLPGVIRVVLPVSAFAASVYVANRLRSDSELVVIQAAGFSPARLARPVAVFGAICAALTMVLTHALVPVSIDRLDQRSAEIAEDVTAGLLTDGEFLHPAEGITLFIGEITPDTELLGLFLSDARASSQRTTYSARRGLLVRSDQGPRLVMYEGMVQTLDRATQRLATTRFDSFAFDISTLIEPTQSRARDADALSTFELFRATPDLQAETGDTRAELIFQGHERFTQALAALVTPLVGFAVMMMGSFSRFGATRQIVAAVCCLIAVELIDNLAADAVLAGGPMALGYAATLFGLALTGVFLWKAAQPKRRRQRAVAA